MQRLDTVGNQAIAQGADDRDAARDAGFEHQIDAGLQGDVEQLGAVQGDDGLIRRHHTLA